MKATGVISCIVSLLVILALVGGVAVGGWKLYEASPRVFVQILCVVVLAICLYVLWIGRGGRQT